jgi:uncharacterized protein (TIGR03492 family)
MNAAGRILFISNGHGEDNHSSYIIETLRELSPSLEIAAMPIVGEGGAYRRLNVPIIGPTQTMPSGGFTYMNRFKLLEDIGSGLIGLTWRQLQAVRRYAATCDLVHATGDTVGQGFAYFSGCPYVSFISCLSSLYEGKLYVGPFLRHFLNSERCLAIVTRDPHTAQDLQRQGFAKAQFGGIPSLDRLVPTGKDLQLKPEIPTLALLPGSRLPEAVRNFRLELQLAREIANRQVPVQFCAALVPGLMAQLPEIASAEGWQQEGDRLRYFPPGSPPEAMPLAAVSCHADAFSDILHRATLVIGMAGLAVDQAVALGKPVVQIPGEGPQFTYAFAEAQTRLLGINAQTIGTKPATPEILREAAVRILETLQDADYLAACAEQGKNRFGPPGASFRIARLLSGFLSEKERTGNYEL